LVPDRSSRPDAAAVAAAGVVPVAAGVVPVAAGVVLAAAGPNVIKLFLSVIYEFL
jgi:hypothetical protein